MSSEQPTGATRARERYERVTTLFDAALDLDTAERAAFVAATSAQDSGLGAELQAMLLAHQQLAGFLEAPAVPDSLRATLQDAVGDRYAIRERIATGGMASVYRADDLRHARQVAIKVLTATVAPVGLTNATPQRFLDEIRVTAALQHVNVMPLFDSGATDELFYFVMPYIGGETLRQQLRRAGPLPVDEAVGIASGVAEALEHAHAKGIVHRDLKPENILIRDGKPLVCDFGIALATAELDGSRQTQTGVIIGTPQYMSPEQAAGDAVIDARTDIYALGAILYEMLVGDPPHVASTSQGVLAKVRAERPTAVRLLRPNVPASVSAAISRALDKQPADRFPSARAFRDALQSSLVAPTRTIAPRTRGRVYVAVGALAAALTVVFWLLNRQRDSSAGTAAAVRFVVAPIRGAAIGRAPTITPDGSAIVYAGSAAADRQIFVRQINELAARALVGTHGALNTFVSPDGRTIAFITSDDRLMRIGLDGGGMRDLGGVFRYSSGAWINDSLLVLDSFGQEGLTWRSMSGGPAHPLTALDTLRHDIVHLAPVALGDGRSFVFTVARNRAGPGSQSGELSLARLDPDAGGTVKYTPLGLDVQSAFAYHDGWILYIRRDAQALMAARLDLAAAKIIGAPVVVLEQEGGGIDAARLASNGTLLYSRRVLPMNTPVVVDSNGAATPIVAGLSGAFMNPRVSPDGRRIAVQRGTEEGTDAWVFDIGTGSQARATRWGSVIGPAWAPDGSHLVYASTIEGRDALWRSAADGSGSPVQLIAASGLFAASPTRDPDLLLFQRRVNGVWSIWRAPVDGEGAPQSIVAGNYDAFMPTLSPDGRWLIYAGSETGRYEIYLRPFPGPGSTLRVSSDGGTEPAWSADGRRIYYRADRKLMYAAFTPGASPAITARRVLFADTFDGDMPMPHRNYDVMPDGRHFVMIAPTGDATPETIVVLNWTRELRARISSPR
jgi:eukaryotic-like serine/threonine-protein kinase